MTIIINSNNNNKQYFKSKQSYKNYRKSLQSIKKNRKSTIKNNKSTKINKKTVKFTNDNKKLAKDIINSYTTLNETSENLKRIIINNINNNKFNTYLNNFVPFNKLVQGKSGAIVGYLKNEPKTVIKFNYYKEKPNYNSLIKINGCLQINNRINEVFINNILNNLDLLNKFSNEELEDIKPYILKLKDSGFYDEGTYIALPLVGFEYIDNNKSIKYITNLTEIIVLNHKELLKKAIKTNNYKIIELYDEYLSLMLGKYFSILQLLVNKLEFINTDLKFNNIFIKKEINNNRKFEDLRKFGFNIDFTLIISDLEKSIYTINNIKTITIPNNPLKVKIAEKIGYGLIYSIRYKCISEFEKKCPKLKMIDYDILFAIVNLLVILHRDNTFPNLKNHLKRTLNIIKTILNINNDNLEIFLKIISNNVFNKDKNVQLYINLIITELCKKLI